MDAEQTQSDWSLEREKFPDALFDALNSLSGGLVWSVDRVNVLNAESVRDIMPFLRDSQDVAVVDDGDYDEYRESVSITVNGQVFKIYGRKERRENEIPDKAFSTNLEVIRDHLNNPGARVLYVGSNDDQTVKTVFGSSAINMDLQGDVLNPGDVKADATRTPFPDNAFDLVVLKNSNDIIRNPELRAEIHRILRNGGVLFSAANTNPEYERGVSTEVDEARRLAREDVDKVYLEDGTGRFKALDIPGIHFAEDMTLLGNVK
ncbi:MAG: methyltransferase domain-containing protein [bacterium]|nr:methyltransferase domain-containing protein [bacterium]